MNASVVFLLAACAGALAQLPPRPNVAVYLVQSKPVATVTTRKPVVFKPIPLPFPEYLKQTHVDSDHVLTNGPFTCEGLKDGHYADVHFDCVFFHQCQFFLKADGSLYAQQAVFECGEGTRFNQTTKTCDYTERVSCDAQTVQNIINYQLIAPIPTPGPSKAKIIPATSFRCAHQSHRNGFYFADEETGCEVYHRCTYRTVEGIVYATHYRFTCPSGTLFNQETISCLDYDKVNCATSRNYWNAQSSLHPKY